MSDAIPYDMAVKVGMTPVQCATVQGRKLWAIYGRGTKEIGEGDGQQYAE